MGPDVSAVRVFVAGVTVGAEAVLMGVCVDEVVGAVDVVPCGVAYAPMPVSAASVAALNAWGMWKSVCLRQGSR